MRRNAEGCIPNIVPVGPVGMSYTKHNHQRRLSDDDYYIQTATSFFGGLIGCVKAVFWPGFLGFELMKFLKM